MSWPASMRVLSRCLASRPHTIDSHHAYDWRLIFPLVAAFARQKGIPLRVDRDEARRQGIDANGVCRKPRFSQRLLWR